ncbi:MAG: ThiF family adenylyltransferase [Candidatus Lokiarchaeota archaeon]|jgi:molybdopterin/thiamine biosynthesis adenylyltransferase|nr:ThiF family adenylyltransferase [Candidatus Lokiarchaeota archaeon]
MTVNKEEIKKSRMYARQQLIEGWDQEIVNEGSVMIVGVGALGCEIAKDFALMGIGKIVLVDLDTIETSNLSRQMLFKPGDEGRPKAEVAAERLKDMNPFLKVDFYFEKLQKLPMSVYEECDVIIAALDNFNARLDLNKICLRLKKPMVEGGTVGFEGHVQVVIPEGSGFEYKTREIEIEKIVETKMWEFDNPEYLDAQKEIEQLEYLIERLKIEKLGPFRKLVRKQVEAEFDKNYAQDLLDITPCYRCLVPIPPADDKLVAACTLKGLPRNRNHCVIKAEVNFEKEYGFKPDMNLDDDVVKLKALAQKELEDLRTRVFNENVSPEKLEALSSEEIQEWKENIKETFGADYKFEEMENILGNKIAAIQSVSSIISSIQSQEALKLLFRLYGRNIGPPMDPPYVNYNGVYGQFDHLDIIKRDDCLACGKIEGEENVQIVVPFDADIGYIFKAMRISGHELEPILWMITNPVNKEMFWNPYMSGEFKDPTIKLTALKVKSNDIITLTPLGKAKVESEIKKYNVIITYM